MALEVRVDVHGVRAQGARAPLVRFDTKEDPARWRLKNVDLFGSLRAADEQAQKEQEHAEAMSLHGEHPLDASAATRTKSALESE